MSLRIITGSTGTNHVTSQDDGSLNQVILGSKSVVLDIGEKLSATIVDNNTVRISDGDLLLQGRHARVDAGTVEDVTIGTGTIEMNRNDLIVARYTLDTATGYEDISFVVIEGTETSGTASDPAYNTGDIRTGSAIVDFPLYRVEIEGINIVGLVRLFEIAGGASSSLIGEAYSAIKNYSFGEVCIDNGVMWTSKISNNIGNAPQEGTYWTKSSIAKQLGGLQFGIDGDGNGGYYKADGSFSPFSNGAYLDMVDSTAIPANYTFTEDYDLVMLSAWSSSGGDIIWTYNGQGLMSQIIGSAGNSRSGYACLLINVKAGDTISRNKGDTTSCYKFKYVGGKPSPKQRFSRFKYLGDHTNTERIITATNGLKAVLGVIWNYNSTNSWNYYKNTVALSPWTFGTGGNNRSFSSCVITPLLEGDSISFPQASSQEWFWLGVY